MDITTDGLNRQYFPLLVGYRLQHNDRKSVCVFFFFFNRIEREKLLEMSADSLDANPKVPPFPLRIARFFISHEPLFLEAAFTSLLW